MSAMGIFTSSKRLGRAIVPGIGAGGDDARTTEPGRIARHNLSRCQND
jgi:hypothetical protein